MLYVDNGIATVPINKRCHKKFSITLYADKRAELEAHNTKMNRRRRRVHCPDKIPYVQITQKEARSLVDSGEAKWISDQGVYDLRSKHIRLGMRT